MTNGARKTENINGPYTEVRKESDYDRGYRQGFQTALITVDLSTPEVDEEARRQIVYILRKAFAKLGGVG